MNKPNQIECELNCKATASLAIDVASNDLHKQDRPIASIINDERSEDDNAAEDI